MNVEKKANIFSAWNNLWFAEVSAYPLAAYRILFGLYMVAYLAFSIPHITLFFSNQGVYSPFLIPDIAPAPLLAYILFGLMFLAALAFTLGYKTKYSAPLLLTLYFYHFFLNIAVKACSYDRLILMSLILMSFGEIDAAWSVKSLKGLLGRKRITPVEEDATSNVTVAPGKLDDSHSKLNLRNSVWSSALSDLDSRRMKMDDKKGKIDGSNNVIHIASKQGNISIGIYRSRKRLGHSAAAQCYYGGGNNKDLHTVRIAFPTAMRASISLGLYGSEVEVEGLEHNLVQNDSGNVRALSDAAELRAAQARAVSASSINEEQFSHTRALAKVVNAGDYAPATRLSLCESQDKSCRENEIVFDRTQPLARLAVPMSLSKGTDVANYTNARVGGSHLAGYSAAQAAPSSLASWSPASPYPAAPAPADSAQLKDLGNRIINFPQILPQTASSCFANAASAEEAPTGSNSISNSFAPISSYTDPQTQSSSYPVFFAREKSEPYVAFGPKVSAWLPRLLALHLAIFYFMTGLFKALSPGWHSGEILKGVMSGVYASDAGFGMLGLHVPNFVYDMMALSVIVFELTCPFFFYVRKLDFSFAIGASSCRIKIENVQLYFFLVGFLFHAGIAIVMQLPQFMICPIGYVLFMNGADVRRLFKQITLKFRWLLLKTELWYE